MSSSSLQALRQQGIRPDRPAYHDTPLLSIGKQVRVQRPERVRRAEIECVDEAAGSAEVAYVACRHAAPPADAPAAGEEPEVEEVPAALLRPLEDCELQSEASRRSLFDEDLYGACAAVKEEGNGLFRLKDHGAAADHYSLAIAELRAKPPVGDCVPVLVNRGGALALGFARPSASSATVADVAFGGGGGADRVRGAPWRALLPVHEAALALHASLHANRARCLQALNLHAEAAQDLSVCVALWTARGEAVRQELSEAEQAERREQLAKAYYLRAKARLARMRVGLARADIEAALGTEPPEATVKLLRQLGREVDLAQKEQLRSNRRLAKEIAKFADCAMQGLDQEALENFGRALPDLDSAG